MKSISAGAHQTCGIDLNDAVHCMGGYSYYNWAWDGVSASSINTASYHACAVTTDAAISCVVPTDDNGDLVVDDIPAAPEGTYTTVASIDATESCALNTQGAVVCWGESGWFVHATVCRCRCIRDGFYGSLLCTIIGSKCDLLGRCVSLALDQGQTTDPEGTFQSLALGQYHSCGVRTTGDIHCWGSIEGSPVEW